MNLPVPTTLVLLAALWVAVWGAVTARIATDRGRLPIVWFIIGAVLGPVGLVILLVAPPAYCRSCLSPVRGWGHICPYCGSDPRTRPQIRRPAGPAPGSTEGSPIGSARLPAPIDATPRMASSVTPSPVAPVVGAAPSVAGPQVGAGPREAGFVARHNAPTLRPAPVTSTGRPGGAAPGPRHSAVSFEEILRQRRQAAAAPEIETNGTEAQAVIPSAAHTDGGEERADVLEGHDGDVEGAQPRLDELGRVPTSVTTATDSFLKGIIRRLDERG